MCGAGAGEGEGCVLVCRGARPAELAPRLQLLRAALADSFWDAFLYFFFQELTLQCVVLTGAVLFIFGGAGPGALALLPAAAAALTAAAVRLHAAALAAHLPHKLRNEEWGFVVEACGALEEGARRGAVLTDSQYREGGYGPQCDLVRGKGSYGPHRKQVIGTISVCRLQAGAGWWVWGLAVGRGWRRRGAGGALLAQARVAVAGEGGEMHAVVSHLQHEARALMHKHGWECRGTYHRPLLGASLVLPMAHLVLPLPHA